LGRSVEVQLKHLDRFIDRHGHPRVYFRRGKGRRIELPLEGSPDFLSAYTRALAATESPPKPTKKAEAERTIRALLRLYFGSSTFKAKANEHSQANSRRILERFAEKHGHRLVHQMQTEHVERILGAMSDTPAAANNLLKRLRRVMKFAVKLKWRTDNPTEDIPFYKEGTFHTWTDAELTQYEAKWPIGTRERVAFDCFLYTGQRRSDVAKMAWPHYDGDLIRVAQQKGDMEGRDEWLWIPAHPNLKASLDALARHNVLILAGPRSRGMSATSLGNFMADAIEAAGLPPRCVPHGLRKAACRTLAEAGCSAKQIMSISGHKTLEEVERYVRMADQKGLARSAITLLSEHRRNG
jgi:integrase